MIALRDIEAAQATIRDVVPRTPCLLSGPFSRRLGANVFFKYENLQLTGSFKVRGALNMLRSLGALELARGVVTASAGNHAQGLAYSARAVGAVATVVMPVTTPLLKIENTERLGGRAVLSGETFAEAYAEGLRLASDRGLVFVPPFEDERVIAGQGTIGLELLDDVPEIDLVVAPIGGGGLISGIATAVKELRPGVRVYGVQTEAAPAMAESLKAGRPVACETRRSVADGIAVKSPGEITFEHVRRYVDEVAVVSEAEIRTAMVDLLETGKTVAEGAAAAVLAAAEAERIPGLKGGGGNVVLVLSGGNVDVQILSRILDRSLVEAHRLVRFKTAVPDRPGALADLLAVIAAAGGNVVRIQHDRVFKHAGFWEAEVQVTLETRNEGHIETLHQALSEHGWVAERLD